jgi:hypothetical protein
MHQHMPQAVQGTWVCPSIDKYPALQLNAYVWLGSFAPIGNYPIGVSDGITTLVGDWIAEHLASLNTAAGGHQRWTWTSDMQLSPTLSPGLCMASCGSAGCNVSLSACSSDDSQRWLYDDRDRLVPLSHPLLCMEWTAPGTVVKLQNCSSTSLLQRWDTIAGV